ncbi:MAG: hypothetical protein O6952_04825 [Planctomycetota bacterium]|nr:hypothetical protein [Planctomycetota bacterium]
MWFWKWVVQLLSGTVLIIPFMLCLDGFLGVSVAYIVVSGVAAIAQSMEASRIS